MSENIELFRQAVRKCAGKEDSTAMDHWCRDVQIWWGRRYLCGIDTQLPAMMTPTGGNDDD